MTLVTVTVLLRSKLSAALSVMVPVPRVPVAPAFPIWSVPALIVVMPVLVLVPESVSAPAAVLVRANAPVIEPEKLLAAASLTVKVAAAPLSVTVPVLAPPSAKPATVWAKPARSKVPVLLTVRVVPAGRALAMPSLSVPALTVVAPL